MNLIHSVNKKEKQATESEKVTAKFGYVLLKRYLCPHHMI
jgi:hypothetical protein